MESTIAWILFGAIMLAGACLVAWTALRATHRGRRFRALTMQSKLQFSQSLLTDPETPLLARGLLIVLLIYLAAPFDVIPDFIPVLGMLDDFAIVVLAMSALLLLVPRDRFMLALEDAEDSGMIRDVGSDHGTTRGAHQREAR